MNARYPCCFSGKEHGYRFRRVMLFGLQIGWAYSRRTSTDTGSSGRVFETVTEHLVE